MASAFDGRCFQRTHDWWKIVEPAVSAIGKGPLSLPIVCTQCAFSASFLPAVRRPLKFVTWLFFATPAVWTFATKRFLNSQSVFGMPTRKYQSPERQHKTLSHEYSSGCTHRWKGKVARFLCPGLIAGKTLCPLCLRKKLQLLFSKNTVFHPTEKSARTVLNEKLQTESLLVKT